MSITLCYVNKDLFYKDIELFFYDDKTRRWAICRRGCSAPLFLEKAEFSVKDFNKWLEANKRTDRATNPDLSVVKPEEEKIITL